MTLQEVCSSLREWTRRVWGALSGRRTDHDLQRELAGHLALAEDELRRKGHAPSDAARLARAGAGGRIQALEALREQRGLPWLDSSWLDVRLGLRLLVRNWGLTLVGGLAMTLAIGIAAVVFAAFDIVMWSPLPLDEGDRVVAIQVWDREAGRRRDTTWQDLERWRVSLQSVGDVGAFQTIRRNIITPDGSLELAPVAEISAAGFRVARVPPLIGRPIADADAAPGAAPVVVIDHDVWQRRFAGARDVIGRELRLGKDVHTVVGVMPEGFQFPFNFRYWVPLRHGADGCCATPVPKASSSVGSRRARRSRARTLRCRRSGSSLPSVARSAEEGRLPRRPGPGWCRTRSPSRGTSNLASWACSGRCRACCSFCCCYRRARTSQS